MVSTGFRVDFFDDAAAFLAAAGDLLAARPVESTVLSTIARRSVLDAAEGIAPAAPYHWFATVADRRGEVVGAAMRTAPFAPYPAYVLAMPEGAATALAEAAHARGEPLPAANGALPAVEIAMTAAARLAGGSLRRTEETRLWELGELREPSGVPGRVRLARPEEAPLLAPWFQAFGAEAAAMAGRSEPHPTADFDEPEVALRIRRGTVWVWEVEGRVVHLSGASAPAFGVARIGPVLTPREHRGHGYASAAVAAVARELCRAGARVCLFTDLANPTTNRIYPAIGFQPVTDMAAVSVVPGDAAG